MTYTQLSPFFAPSELQSVMYTNMLEATGDAPKNRVTRMPYGQAANVGAKILWTGIKDTETALLSDQLEDFAIYRSLQALPRYKNAQDFARVIVESGVLLEGVSI